MTNALWAVIVDNHITAYPAHQAELAAGEAARLRDSGVDVVESAMTATELAMAAEDDPAVTVTYWQPPTAPGHAGRCSLVGRARAVIRQALG